MPDGLLVRRLAFASPLAQVGVAEVEVSRYPVALFQAEEPPHFFVIDDGAGAPHGRETQGVGGELHVLYGGGAGGVVLEGLDLVPPGFRDHGYDHGGAESFLALAADPADGH